MTRQTIDYGIDLGTTNSAVAVLRDVDAEVIPNPEGASFTPSAVWLDRRGRLHVGRLAKERFADEENVALEFKLTMGLGAPAAKTFASTGRTMLPEELSAEVLKALKADVRNSTGEELGAAVITVPAAFDLPQCAATRKAAELAGLTQSPLLQEPVAAALAYGFQSASDKVFWLVYDFGGGTFDAAVIQVREGIIQVVNHAGDNHLGGKLIDWDIVERHLVPVLADNYELPDFRRGSPKWRRHFAKLKMEAEWAKVQVSNTGKPFQVWIEDVGPDAAGNPVELEYEFTPQDLEGIAAPYIERSINLCRRCLEEKRLAPGDMEKVIMVGGTTLLPSLRGALESQLGARLEFSIDPITVVARGAAVFAGTQKMDVPGSDLAEGHYRIEFAEYEAQGSETDPLVGGRVLSPDGSSVEDFTIEFAEVRSEWGSGRIVLAGNGTFMTNVHAERGRRNEFLLELCDASGTRHETVPDRFVYTVGMGVVNPPLTHAVGVAMANNRADWFFEKGRSLPTRERHIHHQADFVRKGQEGEAVRIPVIEGENTFRADRNRLIGYVEIPATDPRVRRDVPRGSDVEITIAIDESRMVMASAFVPVLDEMFEDAVDLRSTPLSLPELRAGLDREVKRLEVLREKAETADDKKADEALDRIEAEDIVGQVESLLAAAEGDQESLAECDRRLLDLMTLLDEAEDALAWPTLVEEVEERLQGTRTLVEQRGRPQEKEALRELEEGVQEAQRLRDADVLRSHRERITVLGFQVLDRLPDFWVHRFMYMEEPEQRAKVQDASRAEPLYQQGRRAMEGGDTEALKAAVLQLWSLMPEESQEELRFKGTTIRYD